MVDGVAGRSMRMLRGDETFGVKQDSSAGVSRLGIATPDVPLVENIYKPQFS